MVDSLQRLPRASLEGTSAHGEVLTVAPGKALERHCRPLVGSAFRLVSLAFIGRYICLPSIMCLQTPFLFVYSMKNASIVFPYLHLSPQENEIGLFRKESMRQIVHYSAIAFVDALPIWQPNLSPISSSTYSLDILDLLSPPQFAMNANR